MGRDVIQMFHEWKNSLGKIVNISVILWQERSYEIGIYIDLYRNDQLNRTSIIDVGETEKFVPGPSLKTPGATRFYRKFECPRCLRLHKFPEGHGSCLQCGCGATWSFWGAGASSPEGDTLDEVIAFIRLQRPDIFAEVKE